MGIGMTHDELTDALSTLPHGKRPGSDGLPYEFYTAFWEVLAAPLLDVWVEAFAGGSDACLSSSMRKGLIALLYKGAGLRDSVANYRPITLLNADYKIIAKALAMRFADPLNAVIDPTHVKKQQLPVSHGSTARARRKQKCSTNCCRQRYLIHPGV